MSVDRTGESTPFEPAATQRAPPRFVIGARGGTTARTARSGRLLLGVGRTARIQPIPVTRDTIPCSGTESPPLPRGVTESIQSAQANTSGENVVNQTITGTPHKRSPMLDTLQNLAKTPDADAFKKAISEIDDSKEQVISDLLVSLALTGDDKSYDFVVEQLISMYPKIEDFIRFQKGRVITCKGLQHVLKPMKEKRPWIIDTTLIDKVKRLKKEFAAIASSNEDMKKIIIFDEGAHFRPIFVVRTKGKTKILLSDSMGDKWARKEGLSAKQVLKAIPGATVYSLSEGRQTDLNTCSVFALRDVIQLSRYEHEQKHSIFDYAEEHEQERNSERDIIFSRLPPEMMKVTQSVPKLSIHYPEVKELLEKKRAKGKQFIVTDPTSRSGQRNVYMKRKFQKYERLLIAAAIREGIAEGEVIPPSAS